MVMVCAYQHMVEEDVAGLGEAGGVQSLDIGFMNGVRRCCSVSLSGILSRESLLPWGAIYFKGPAEQRNETQAKSEKTGGESQGVRVSEACKACRLFQHEDVATNRHAFTTKALVVPGALLTLLYYVTRSTVQAASKGIERHQNQKASLRFKPGYPAVSDSSTRA